MNEIDPLKAFALFDPGDLDEAPRELGRDQGLLQGLPRVGERLGERYLLVESLGRGGMGLVFRGLDESLKREVAVKVLLLEGEGPRQRFEREAEVTASLQARHVVRVFANGFFRGYPYIVYELIEGGSLLEALATEPLERRLALVEEVAEGLSAAHAQGVVHRDLKPENVLIRPTGEAVVVDFGLAGVARSSLTHTGEVMGTPAYMAPEQVRGQEATRACDVWALGLLLYEAVYESHPFLAGESTLPVLIWRITEGRVDYPRGGPSALRALIQRSLVVDPARRLADAGVFLEQLRAARAAPAQESSRRLIAGALALGGLALAGGLLGWSAVSADPPSPRATPSPSATLTPRLAESASPSASPSPTLAEESAESLFQRGFALARGDEPQDYEGGLRLMAEAARQDHPEALYEIGRYQLYGGAEGGRRRAEMLFRQASALGHSGAMWQLGKLADDDANSGTAAEALAWYRRAARQGHVPGMYILGLSLLQNAHGVKDPENGIRWLERAAEGGHPPAKCQFAMRLVSGDHVPADPERGILLLEEAVASQDALAEYLLGRWLMNGQWVEQDVERGRVLINKSAAQGETEALRFLEEEGQEAPQER